MKEVLRNYKKIYVLNISLPGAGFGAVLLTTLNQIRYCERNNYYPIINYDASCQNAFFDQSMGDELWGQYFEQILLFGYQELQDALKKGVIKGQDVITLPDEEMIKISEEDPESIYSYTFGKWRFNKPDDLASWFQLQRQKGRETIQKYVKPNEHILDKVNKFYTKYLQSSFLLGVHIRGTDLHYAPPVSPPEYFPYIQEMIDKHPDLKVFLATDQRQYIQVFQEQYGERVYYADCFRSDNEVAPFNRAEISPHKKGEDVLLDMLLLSKSDFLIKGTSNVSEFALYFNPKLECIDLSISKTKAFGQDYEDGWDNMTNLPAWQLVQARGLKQVSQDASSQTMVQKVKFNSRKITKRVQVFLGAVKRKIIS